MEGDNGTRGKRNLGYLVRDHRPTGDPCMDGLIWADLLCTILQDIWRRGYMEDTYWRCCYNVPRLEVFVSRVLTLLLRGVCVLGLCFSVFFCEILCP